MKARYRINEPDVTHESFDAEILAINLKNGNYYSLLGTAIPVWHLLAQGQSVDEIGRLVARHCGEDEAKVTGSVASFAQQLQDENLMVPRDAATAATNDPVPLPASFTAPTLDRYTDMQQLLLMDPIHEVDATGWPVAKPAQDTKA